MRRRLQTTAIRDGDVYVLNGTKRFITNANRAGLFTVMARTDPEKKGAAGISAFIVPAKTPGIVLGKPEKKMGQQGAHICDVIFENARVPARLVWAKKARASRSPCRCSTAAGCTSPPSASASPSG